VYFKRSLCDRYRTRYTKNLRYLRVISRSVRPYCSYIILPSTFGTSSYPSTRSSVYPFPRPTLPTLRYPRYGIPLRYVINKKNATTELLVVASVLLPFDHIPVVLFSLVAGFIIILILLLDFALVVLNVRFISLHNDLYVPLVI